MRHGASLIAAIEGISRSAFHIARELSQNSRSGLTTRFLAKKLELPEEEVEYLVDVNDRLFFLDLTKVKLVAEGPSAVKRISEGLESRGDVEAIFRAIKAMDGPEFRRIEERIGIDDIAGKKAAAEELIARYYRHPDSVVEYVATRRFSPLAQELFDLLWQSEDAIVPVSWLRSSIDRPEYEIESALDELCGGLALFEMFRFDAEDRLVRVVALLSEIRQWRESGRATSGHETPMKPFTGTPDHVVARGLGLSDRVCRLVAAAAARPIRLRADGELFREDRRRLEELCPGDDEPSLDACLWMARNAKWLAHTDNELRAEAVDALLERDRLAREQALFSCLNQPHSMGPAVRLLTGILDDLETGVWYRARDVIRHALRVNAAGDQPILRQTVNHWRYVGSATSPHLERGLEQALDEGLLWCGAVERADAEGEGLVRLTDLGRYLLTGEGEDRVRKALPGYRTEIIVQPNFDVVVPMQETDPLLTVPLDQFADRVSTGQAAVFRLSKESITRGLQSGHDVDRFIRFLFAHNRGGALPENVSTTLEDWRGGIKRVRVRTIHVIESDDPLVLADLSHRKRFSRHLQAIDPSRAIAYAKISKAKLVKELERDGFVVG